MCEGTIRAVFCAILVAVVALPLPGAELSDEEVAKRLDACISAADGFSGAVLVARGGKVLLEKGYGSLSVATGMNVESDSVFTTGSITKQFTAAAIMKLESEKRLAVTDEITKYLDDVPVHKQSITLHHLLTHSAGFEGAIGDDFERIGRDAFVRRALDSKLLFAPGEKYEYTNVGYSLLAAIVEKVSGMGYEEYLRKSFFEPLGMNDTGYNLPKWDAKRLAHGVDNDGGDWGTLVDKAFGNGGPGWHLVGNGGIHSTVRDMYRWHVALENGKALPKESVARMYEPWVEEPGGTHYGYGWSIDTTPRNTRLIAHNGGNPYFFSDFWRFIDEDVVIYYSTNSRERSSRRLAPALAAIVFRGEAPPPPAKPKDLTGPAAAPDSAAGRWGMPDDPRAHAAAAFLDALSLETDEERRAYVSTAFDPGAIERNGIEGLANLLVRLHDDLGEFEYEGIGESGERIEIRLSGRGGQMPFRLQLRLEPDPPHRIMRLGVEAGG